MPATIDEERRCGVQVHQLGIQPVILNAIKDFCGSEILGEPVEIQTELLGISDQIGLLQFLLVGEHHPKHLKEPALPRCRLRGLRGDLGMRVQLTKWQVPPDPANVVTEVTAHRID
jgi:hypothetical protein